MTSVTEEIKICRSTRTIFQYSLIWPPDKDELNPGKMYLIRVLILTLLTVSGWGVGTVMHLIASLKSDANLYLSEDISFVVAACGLYYVTFAYVNNQQKLAHLMKDLSNFREFGTPPNFEANNKRLNLIGNILVTYTTVGTSMYNGVKLWDKTDCEEINERVDFNQVCGSMVPFWIPMDTKDHLFFYYFCLFYVFLCSQIFIKLSLMISFQSAELAHHISFRIDHLNMMIRTCFDSGNYKTCRFNLKKCVQYHWKILDFASRLDNCFSIGMFAHITITSVIIGCIEKQFVDRQHRLCAGLHASGWALSLFIACFGGQKIINASDTIPEAIYASKWYNVEISLAKDLNFMLIRSQESLKITSGPFGVMSFAVFLSVIKMSYSILCMLTS